MQTLQYAPQHLRDLIYILKENLLLPSQFCVSTPSPLKTNHPDLTDQLKKLKYQCSIIEISYLHIYRNFLKSNRKK